ncbi:MAG: ElyC/SanA/YdcF family protein [Thermoguttaceae bacterium]
MYLFKKLVSRFFFPLPLCLGLLLAGLILLWFTKKQKAGKTLVSIAVLLLMLLSHSVVGDMLLGRLESAYPALADPAAACADASGIPCRWIVVLGGGYSPKECFPLSARPSGGTLVRMVEGIRIQKELPGAKLLLSADSSVGPNRSAADLTRLATTLGVDRRSVATMEGAKDTEEELDLIQRIVGEDRFILVTSASHMPRAVALFRARGLDPIPAPTGHAAGRKRWTTPDEFFPDLDGLAASSTAFYEYLGLAWAKVRGRIP